MQHGVRRALVILVAVIIFLTSLALSGRLHLDEDITSLLPTSDPVVADFLSVLKRFRALDSLYIDVGPATGGGTGSDAEIVAVADALCRRLEQSGMFTEIHYRSSPEQMLGVARVLSEHKQNLFDEKDLAAVAARLEPAEVEARVQAARKTLLEPSGAFAQEQLRRDPLGLDEIGLARLQGLAREGGGARIVDGRLWSADRRHVLITAATEFRATDTRKGAALAAMLAEARRAALREAPKGAVQIVCVGGHLSAVENAATMKRDVARTVTANAIAIALLGLLAHRRKMFLGIVFLPAIFGMACATIVFALANPFISAITIGCAGVLVAVTVDYDFQILYRIDNTDPEALAPQACVRGMLLQVAAAAGTTIAAFLCLTRSALPGQRQMGWFAAVGVGGSALFSLVGLVYLIPRVRKLRWAWVIPLRQSCEAFLAWRARHRRSVAAAGLALLAAGALGLSRLSFEGDVTHLDYRSPARIEGERLLRSVWGELPSASVMVQGKTQADALDANDRVAAALGEMADAGVVRHFTSISTLLPSPRTQEENARRWGRFWTAEQESSLRSRMAAAMASAHFAPTAFQAFYDGLDARGTPPLTLRDFQGTAVDALIGSHVKTAEGKWFVLSTFSVAKDGAFPEVAARIRKAVPDATVMDRRSFVEHAAGLTRRELKTLALIASLATAVALYLFVRRLELVIAVFLPVWLSILFTLGALGWTGEPINPVSSLFIVFVFGIGIHYSIALMTNSIAVYNGHGVDDSIAHGAVLLCSLISVVSFASLAFARHPALFSIGLAGLIGIVSSFCAAVLVVPAILRRLLPLEGRYGTPSLKTWGGALWAFAYLGGLGALYTLLIRHVVRLRHARDPEARRRFARWYLHKTAAGLLRFFPYLDSERVYVNAGPEAFRPAGVIVCNHLSAFDIMAILALPAPMAMAVKGWVWTKPIIGCIVRDAGHILVEEEGAEALFREGAERMEQGVCVMVFPEGTRSPDGRPRRFHKGAFDLAIRAGRDVIPVFLTDTQAVLPQHCTWVGDHRVVVRVLPRVTPANFDYGLGARAMAEHVKRLMLAHAESDWRLAQDGKAFWHNLRTVYNYRGAYVESYVRWKLRLDPIYRQVDSLLPLRGAVLDLGCAYGLMSHIIARKSLERRVTGVDFDERKVGIARQTATATPNLGIEMQDILEWDYPPSDAALLIDVLHYWSPEKQQRILKKASACLPAGGTMVVREACPPATRPAGKPGRASAASAWRHRATAWSERFARVARRNRAGDGLIFLERGFYLEEFRRNGLVLQPAPAESGRGSNELFVLRKGPALREPPFGSEPQGRTT